MSKDPEGETWPDGSAKIETARNRGLWKGSGPLPKNRDERFALLIFSGYSQPEAGKEAGFSDNKKQNQERRWRKDIAGRIRELQNRAARKAVVDKGYVMEGYREIVERCLQRVPVMDPKTGDVTGEHEFNASGARAALYDMGVEIGMFVKTKVLRYKPIEEMNEEELKNLFGGELPPDEILASLLPGETLNAEQLARLRTFVGAETPSETEGGGVEFVGTKPGRAN